jgi:hypothetical protein
VTTEFIPESLAELSRFFVEFRKEIRDDFAEIKDSLKDTVSRDVYAVEQQALKESFAAERSALSLRIAALEEDRKATRQRANQAVVLGLTGLVFPLVVIIVSWILLGQSKG